MSIAMFLYYITIVAGMEEDFILSAPEISADVHLRNLNNECHPDEMIKVIKDEHKCSPTPIRFPLKLPILSNFTQILPNYVTIYKCIGACQDHICIPSVHRTVSKTVTVNSCSEHGCNRSCGQVMLQEDLKCKCQCPFVICNTNIKMFDQDICECTCKNINQKFRCLEKGHSWDEDRCVCNTSQTSKDQELTPKSGINYNLITSLLAIAFGLAAITISVFCWLNAKYREYIVTNGQAP